MHGTVRYRGGDRVFEHRKCLCARTILRSRQNATHVQPVTATSPPFRRPGSMGQPRRNAGPRMLSSPTPRLHTHSLPRGKSIRRDVPGALFPLPLASLGPHPRALPSSPRSLRSSSAGSKARPRRRPSHSVCICRTSRRNTRRRATQRRTDAGTRPPAHASGHHRQRNESTQLTETAGPVGAAATRRPPDTPPDSSPPAAPSVGAGPQRRPPRRAP